MVVHVVIRPGVPPADRAAIEDRVVEALGAGAESVGGGTMLDAHGALVESDFDVEVPDGADRSALRIAVREVLEQVRFRTPSAFTVDVFDNDDGEELGDDLSDDDEPTAH